MYLPKTGAGDGLERILNPAQWVAIHPGYSQGGVTQSYGALLSSDVIDDDNGVTFEKKQFGGGRICDPHLCASAEPIFLRMKCRVHGNVTNRADCTGWEISKFPFR